MKTRIIILAAMLAAAVGAQAQYSSEYYHRTGDTVYNKSEIGFYNWWEFEQLVQNRDIFGYQSFIAYGTVTMMQYFTPVPIRIVGIAGCPQNSASGPFVDTTTRQEYFYLYDHENGNIIYKDRLAWNFRDPHRTLVLPYNRPHGEHFDSCCGAFYDEIAIPLYEYYFDTVITVADSFFVGWSGASNHPIFAPGYMPLFYHSMGTIDDAEACDELDLGLGNRPLNDSGDVTTISTCGAIPVFTYWFCDDTAINTNPQGEYTWRFAECDRRFVLVYPLVEVDTTVPPSYMCEQVQNFQATVMDTGSGCVFFTWDDFYHYTYCEVEYYAEEQGLNSAVTTTVTGTNMLHLCGLDTMLTYRARIRAYCDTSKTETEWSDWTNFSFPHSDPPQGVAEPSLLDRFTHVMPNPAADKVTVTSELGLRRIEVYNARGILVYSEPSGYSTMTIDLRGWPAGQYMMTIETRQGKTAKKLVVAR